MAGALSMDDKLLGEKMHYYCSSSEDEEEEKSGKLEQPSTTSTATASDVDLVKYSGKCSNVSAFVPLHIQ